MVLHEEHGTAAAFRPREQEYLAQVSILSPHRGLCQGEFRILCKVLTASSPTGGSSPRPPSEGVPPPASPLLTPVHVETDRRGAVSRRRSQIDGIPATATASYLPVHAARSLPQFGYVGPSKGLENALRPNECYP